MAGLLRLNSSAVKNVAFSGIYLYFMRHSVVSDYRGGGVLRKPPTARISVNALHESLSLTHLVNMLVVIGMIGLQLNRNDHEVNQAHEQRASLAA